HWPDARSRSTATSSRSFRLDCDTAETAPMRAVLLRSLLVIGVGGLVLAGVLYVASTVDARPPVVLSITVTQPVAGDPNVALITTSIEVAFSEPVEADGAAEAVRLDPAVDGTASWSGSTLIFTPAEA